jgi:signal transduction histidine kinase
MKTELQERADVLASNVQRSVDACLEVLRSISQLYASTDQVERQEFCRFVQPALARHPSIHALEWLPRVADADRLAFEQSLQAQGYPHFRITERTSKGEIVCAQQRQEYFPVCYVEPLAHNQLALGFDLASDVTRRAALEKARDTGTIAVSGRIELVQAQQRQFGILVVLPIYRQGVELETVSLRRQHLQGLVLGVFRIADILRSSLAGLNLEHLDFYLHDRSNVPSNSFLSAYDSESKRVIADCTPSQSLDLIASTRSPGLNATAAYRTICTRNFDIADRQWSLVLTPTLNYVDRAELYQQSRIRADAATAEATKLKRALQNLQQTQAKWLLEKKLIAIGVGLVLLVLTGANVLSYWSMTRLLASRDRLEQTYAVLASLARILSVNGQQDVASVDTNINTNTGSNPNRGNEVRQSLEADLAILRQAALDRTLVSQQVTVLEQLIQNQPTQAAVSPLLQQRIDALEQEARSRLQYWRSQVEANAQTIFWINLIGITLSFALLLGIYYLLQRQISERQQVESALFQANNQLELEVQEREAELAYTRELTDLKLKLFSMVSHEFRTPLSTILVSTQLLTNTSNWSEEKKVKNLSRIQTAAKTMAQLLSDILTLNRAEAGKLDFRPELLDLDSFCCHLIEEVQLSTETQQPIQFVNQSTIAQADLDSKLLHSILTNLLVNAVKYAASDRPIQLSLSNTDSEIIFQIQDEGVGISADDLPKLFDAFYRGKTSGDVAGTGLGLAVVKTCVDLHGGQVTVESEPGKGTLFTVRLPRSGS